MVFFKFLLFSRLRLATFDSRGKLLCGRSTGYQLLTLEKDQVSHMVYWLTPFLHLKPYLMMRLLLLPPQEYVVMNLDSRLLSFPLYVGCNFLYTSPHSDQRPDSSEQESTAQSVS